MKWPGITLLLAAALTVTSPPAPTRAASAPAFDTAPATASLSRLLPGHAAQFRLLPTARPATGDAFSIDGTPGAITVRGTSGATLLSGVGWYLEHVAGVDLGWPGDSLDRLPAVLPAPAGPITRAAAVPHRYALNDTDAGYSGPYRDFTAYRHEIDLLALHGVNEVFVQTGPSTPISRRCVSSVTAKRSCAPGFPPRAIRAGGCCRTWRASAGRSPRSSSRRARRSGGGSPTSSAAWA